MPKNASQNGFDPMRKAVREMEQLGGYEHWRDKFRYGHRWNIEGYNSQQNEFLANVYEAKKKKTASKRQAEKSIDYERMKKYAQKRVNSLQFS